MRGTVVFQLDNENLSQLKKIQSKYVDSGLTYGWKANHEKSYDQGHWNRKILNNSRQFPFDHEKMPYIDRHPEIKNLWVLIQNFIGKRSLLRTYINSYTFGTDGYAHKDDIWIAKKFGEDSLSETVIVYLNEKWNIDWAGETVIFDQDLEIEKSILPKYGRILIFDSNKLHAARPISRACSILRTVLVFKTIDPKINQPEIKFLLERTKDSVHKDKSFFEHLFNTMLILEQYTQNQDLLLACLFHAVYGTEYYKFQCPFEREEVKSVIGHYSELLVKEFCTIKDRFNTLIENKNNYSEEFRKDLLMIEMANLLDQNKSGRHQSQIDQIKELYSLKNEKT
jgi:SM-20-related protein